MVHLQWEAHSLPQSTAPLCLFIGSRPKLWVADYTVSTCPWPIWLTSRLPATAPQLPEMRFMQTGKAVMSQQADRPKGYLPSTDI